MEQQHPSITPIEARILSEITPEDAQSLVSFMLKLPAPKRINPSLTWEESHHIDNLLDKVRSFLTFRAEEQEV